MGESIEAERSNELIRFGTAGGGTFGVETFSVFKTFFEVKTFSWTFGVVKTFSSAFFFENVLNGVETEGGAI